MTADPARLPGLDEAADRRRKTFHAKADLPVADGLLRRLAADDGLVKPTVDMLRPVCREVFDAEPVGVAPLVPQGTFHALYRVDLHQRGRNRATFAINQPLPHPLHRRRRASGGVKDGSDQRPTIAYGLSVDNRSCVLRVNRLSHLYRDCALHLDGWAAEVLAQRGLPGTAVYSLDLSRRWCPFDYALMAEAAGTSLRTFDERNALTPGMLESVGAFFGRLHTIEADGFGPIDLKPIALGHASTARARGVFTRWQDYIWLNLRAHLHYCREIGVVNAAEERRALAHFTQAETMLADVSPVLLHGDPGSHNIFSDGEKVTAIVDWEDCLCGDPVYEIALWGTFHPDERLAPFLVGYRTTGTLPEDFTRRYWLYYLRISLAKTVHRHRFNYVDRPGRPPASQRIQKSLRRLDRLSGR